MGRDDRQTSALLPLLRDGESKDSGLISILSGVLHFYIIDMIERVLWTNLVK